VADHDITAELASDSIGIDRLTPRQQVTGQQPACWEVDPEVFFGPADSPAGRSLHVWERRALAVCASCPVVRACLAEALEFPAAEQYGVVGGKTAGQRKAVLWASPRGRGRAQRPRTGDQDVSPPRGGKGRPRRRLGPTATLPQAGPLGALGSRGRAHGAVARAITGEFSHSPTGNR
jgi:hypothetical protein